MQTAADPSSQPRAPVHIETLPAQHPQSVFWQKSLCWPGWPQTRGELSLGHQPSPPQGRASNAPRASRRIVEMSHTGDAGPVSHAPGPHPVLIIPGGRVSGLALLLHHPTARLNRDVSLLPPSERTHWQFPGNLCALLGSSCPPGASAQRFLPLLCVTGQATGALQRH